MRAQITRSGLLSLLTRRPDSSACLAAARLRAFDLAGTQHPATKNLSEFDDHLIVADSEVAIAAEKFFDQKVVEELHVSGGEPDRRVYAVIERAALFQGREISLETSPQVLGQALEHLAEVAILKLQDIYVHQQPEIVMVIDHLLDESAKLDEACGLKRFFDLVEDGAQARVYRFLILANDGFEDFLFGSIIIVQIAERSARPR